MLEISGRHQEGHQMIVELAYSQAGFRPRHSCVARDITARKRQKTAAYISLQTV